MKKQEMLPFFGARNLVELRLVEIRPWAFNPGKDLLARARSIPKTGRIKWMTNPATDWQVYSTVGGACPRQACRQGQSSGGRSRLGG